MEPCTLGALAGVFVGWALGAGMQPRAIHRALGSGRAGKLLRLLELLEEPAQEDELEDELEEEDPGVSAN